MNCEVCGKPIPANRRADTRYCSNNCSVRAYRHRRKYTLSGFTDAELQTLAAIRQWSSKTADILEARVKTEGVPKVRPIIALFRKFMFDCGLTTGELL